MSRLSTEFNLWAWSQKQNAPSCRIHKNLESSQVQKISLNQTGGCIFWPEKNLGTCITRKCIWTTPYFLWTSELLAFNQKAVVTFYDNTSIMGLGDNEKTLNNHWRGTILESEMTYLIESVRLNFNSRRIVQCMRLFLTITQQNIFYVKFSGEFHVKKKTSRYDWQSHQRICS